MDRIRALCAGITVVFMMVLAVHPCAAMTVHPPGYLVSLFRNAAAEDIDIDSTGTFYLSLGSRGVGRISPAGDSTRWSSAIASDLTLAPSGDGYAAGRNLCNCIQSISSDGSFSMLHQDTLVWSSVALTSDGSLYATGSSRTTQGLYRIDRATGEATPVVLGGPGPGATGSYSGLASGTDGKLYVTGRVDFSATGSQLFRLDGSQLTSVASLPHGASEPIPGPDGTIYVHGGFDYGSGYPVSEVWGVNPATGESWKFASSGSYFHNWNPQFGPMAYDSRSETLYLYESGVGIWAIKKIPPIQVTWGEGGARADTISATVFWSIQVNTPVIIQFERRTESTEFAWVGNLSQPYSGGPGWYDTRVVPGTRYGYRAGVLVDTAYVWSSTVWVDVPALTPPAPPIVVWKESGVATVDTSSVALDWPINPDIAGDARIERRRLDAVFGSVGTVHLTGSGHVEFLDATVERGTSYVYRAGVLSDSGWAWSDELSADIPSRTPDHPPAIVWGSGVATVDSSSVTLEWPVETGISGGARIERRTPSTSFGLLATVQLVGDGKVRFVDEDVRPGTSYLYRAGLVHDTQWTWSNELEADIPSSPVSPASYVLGFARGKSLVTQGSLDVEFTVPAAGRANVDAFDVRGHRVASARIEAALAGAYSVRVAGGSDLRPGMYFLRLEQGAAFAQCRAIVLGR